MPVLLSSIFTNGGRSPCGPRRARRVVATAALVGCVYAANSGRLGVLCRKRFKQAKAHILAPERRFTSSVLAVHAICFALQIASNGAVMQWGARVAQDKAAIQAGKWWRIFTPTFLHGSFVVFVYNMQFLAYSSWFCERELGSKRTAAIYSTAAVATELAGLCFHTWPQTYAMLGCTGATLGLIGAQYVWNVREDQWLHNLNGKGNPLTDNLVPDLQFAAVCVAMTAWAAHTIQWYHLCGLPSGALAAYVLGPHYSPRPVWREVESHQLPNGDWFTTHDFDRIEISILAWIQEMLGFVANPP